VFVIVSYLDGRLRQGRVRMDPSAALKTFRSLQILISSYNKTFGLLALPQQNINSLLMAAFCVYGSVRFYESLSIFAYLLFPTSLIAIVVFCAVVFTLSANITIASRLFLKSWRRVESTEVQAELNSCRALVISIGPFNFIEPDTFLLVLLFL